MTKPHNITKMCNSYDGESLINKLSSFINTGKINVPHVYYVFQ